MCLERCLHLPPHANFWPENVCTSTQTFSVDSIKLQNTDILLNTCKYDSIRFPEPRGHLNMMSSVSAIWFKAKQVYFSVFQSISVFFTAVSVLLWQLHSLHTCQIHFCIPILLKKQLWLWHYMRVLTFLHLDIIFDCTEWGIKHARHICTIYIFNGGCVSEEMSNALPVPRSLRCMKESCTKHDCTQFDSLNFFFVCMQYLGFIPTPTFTMKAAPSFILEAPDLDSSPRKSWVHENVAFCSYF